MEHDLVREEAVGDGLSSEIAHVFLGAKSDPTDPQVRAAYLALAVQSDQVLAASSTDAPWNRVSVEFTLCEDPYRSDDEMIAAARATGVLEVASVAIDRERRHPLLDSQFGGTYDRFRAVHDLMGHVQPGFGFDRVGERSAWLVQEGLYRGIAKAALATELQGEYSVLVSTGEYAEHKAVILGCDVFERVRLSLTGVPRTVVDERQPVSAFGMGTSRWLSRRLSKPSKSWPTSEIAEWSKLPN
jgi:hypothetical protein